MTDKQKRRSFLAGMIIFWLCVLAVLIATTTRSADADQTIQITMPDGKVVNATIEDPDPNQATYDLMNALTAGRGHYVPTLDGRSIWIPRTPYGPGKRTYP